MPIGKDSIKKRVAKAPAIVVDTQTGEIAEQELETVSLPIFEVIAPQEEPLDASRQSTSAVRLEPEALWEEVLSFIVTRERIGTSLFQRNFTIGYGRAAKIIDRLEEVGFVGFDNGQKTGRTVLLTADKLEELRKNGTLPPFEAPVTPIKKPSTKKSTGAAKKTAAKKPAPESKTAPVAEPTVELPVATATEPATAVMGNVAPETVEKVIGHPETTPAEHVQIGHKMPNYLL